MVTRNCAAPIADYLGSVAGQPGTDRKHVVVDGGQSEWGPEYSAGASHGVGLHGQ